MIPVEESIWAAVAEKIVPAETISVRLRFHCRLILTTLHTLTELSTAPMALRMAISPNAASESGWDKLPDHCKILYEEAMEVMMELIGRDKH
jgi:hypothetical protein